MVYKEYLLRMMVTDTSWNYCVQYVQVVDTTPTRCVFYMAPFHNASKDEWQTISIESSCQLSGLVFEAKSMKLPPKKKNHQYCFS